MFGFMDGEYDSRCGGLLLDGGQEGKLAFTPEELHHPLRDVCRGMDSSPNIWRKKREMVRLEKRLTGDACSTQAKKFKHVTSFSTTSLKI